jgi:hypothetical protein
MSQDRKEIVVMDSIEKLEKLSGVKVNISLGTCKMNSIIWINILAIPFHSIFIEDLKQWLIC